VVHRSKAAFGTPIRSWMKENLAAQTLASFTRRDTPFGKIFREDLPIRLLHEHASGQADNAHRLWGLLSLATWLSIQQDHTSDILS